MLAERRRGQGGTCWTTVTSAVGSEPTGSRCHRGRVFRSDDDAREEGDSVDSGVRRVSGRGNFGRTEFESLRKRGVGSWEFVESHLAWLTEREQRSGVCCSRPTERTNLWSPACAASLHELPRANTAMNNELDRGFHQYRFWPRTLFGGMLDHQNFPWSAYHWTPATGGRFRKAVPVLSLCVSPLPKIFTRCSTGDVTSLESTVLSKISAR
jgi:hypothetical protein